MCQEIETMERGVARRIRSAKLFMIYLKKFFLCVHGKWY